MDYPGSLLTASRYIRTSVRENGRDELAFPAPAASDFGLLRLASGLIDAAGICHQLRRGGSCLLVITRKWSLAVSSSCGAAKKKRRGNENQLRSRVTLLTFGSEGESEHSRSQTDNCYCEPEWSVNVRQYGRNQMLLDCMGVAACI